MPGDSKWEADLEKVVSAIERRRGEATDALTKLSTEAIQLSLKANPLELKALEIAVAALKTAVWQVKESRKFAANDPLSKVLDRKSGGNRQEGNEQ